MNDLRKCCAEVMDDKDVTSRYPKGLNASEILNEIRIKHEGAFPLVSILDVIDEMNALYR